MMMNPWRLDQLLVKKINWIFLTGLFILPLLFSTRFSEVFELPKMAFVYGLTVVITACWLARMVINRRILISRTPLDIPMLLFLLSQIVSAIYSIDPHTSWWGYYSRFHGGLWPTISYTTLFYAWVSNSYELWVVGSGTRMGRRGVSAKPDLSSPSLLNTQLTTHNSQLGLLAIFSSALLVGLYAILQRFGIDKDFWVQDVANRVFSTQGQPNWLAAYLVMVLPLGWAITLDNHEQKTENKKQRTSLLFAFCSLLFALALLWTKSRSGLIGLAVADVVFWGSLLLERSDPDVRRGQTLIRPALLAHAMLAILLFLIPNPARDFLIKRQTPSPTNVTDMVITPIAEPRKSEHGGTESGDIRRIVWSGAIDLTKKSPLVGFGPETFAYTYWRVRPQTHNLTSEWNFIYNKAHNEWLNLAANTGLFGLTSHLLLLGWFIVWSIRNLRFTFYDSRFTSRAFLSALLGIEAINFFGFSTVTTGAYSYLFMAMAIASKNKEQKTKNNEQNIKSQEQRTKNCQDPSFLFSAFCFLIIILAALYLLSQISIWLVADAAYHRGQKLSDAGYTTEALAPLQSAVTLLPSEPVFRSKLAVAQGIASLVMSLPEASNQAIVFKDAAISNFSLAMTHSPANLSILKDHARITYALGEIDPALYQSGMDLTQQAISLAPTDPRLFYSLGVMLDARGDSEAARQAWQQALQLKPDFEDAKNALENDKID